MKIKSFNIENFRSVKKLSLEFPENGLLALVGPNNAGKSNILKALNNVLGESWFSGEKAEINDYYRKEKNNTIKINIQFDNDWSVVFNSSEKWPVYYDENNGKITAWNAPIGSSGSVKDDFPCTYLEANRSLEKNLQFRSYELMGKIAKVFNEKAQSKKQELEEKFDEVMKILDEVNGFSQFKTDFINFFDEMQSDSPYRLKINFKAFTPLNYFKSINILANDTSINDQYDIDIIELGEGNKNLIIFALLRSYAKNFKKEATGLLEIEEPEIYLHPQARRHLFSILKEIVKNSNIQIVYSTHSVSFVKIEDFDSIGLVSKTAPDGTRVRLLTNDALKNFCLKTGVPENKITEHSLIEYYSTISNYRLNEAFFSKILILVEGETEEMALPAYLKALGVNCDSQGISVIGVNGKNQIPKYWRLFYLLGIPMIILFDNDDSEDKKNSNKNLVACFNSEEKNILENCSIDKIIETNKKDANNDIVFQQKIMVLEKDFETALKKDLENYCKDKNIVNKFDQFTSEAKSYIKPLPNTQKGQIARFIAEKITTEYTDYKPTFIGHIIEEIKELSRVINMYDNFTTDNTQKNENTHEEVISLDDIPF